ncbi:MAG: hypothetical protein HQL68_06800 [Magnetococcales bacterium]|nr:hypothetical protein [Magnetococcales bacterium]
MDDKQVLNTKEAADYVGCTSVEQFRREVDKGIWPDPIVRSRPFRWSKPALDYCLQPDSSQIKVDQGEILLDRVLGLAT